MSSSLSRLIDPIRVLTSQGVDILEVELDGDSDFFCVDGFEAPVGGSVHTAPFIQFNGFLINEFLKNNIAANMEQTAIKSRFEVAQQGAIKMRFQFSDNHRWRLYSEK